jgi:hypothetical protein
MAGKQEYTAGLLSKTSAAIFFSGGPFPQDANKNRTHADAAGPRLALTFKPQSH